MGKKVKEYKAGDFIFAKVKGYPAWPARVQKPNGKKYFVYFYGTGETANLSPNMIFDYADNKDKFLTKTVKRRDFNLGVRQIEHDFANNVPLEQMFTPEIPPAESSTLESGTPFTMLETLDDTGVDTTAPDDTTVEDTTINTTTTTQNDTAIEDSDDTGNLVIDEGKQKQVKKAKNDVKAKETPAKPVKDPKTPRGKGRKDETGKTDDEQKKEEEIVSRSGRKIRPKKYMDQQDDTPQTPPAPKRRRGPSSEKNIKQFNAITPSDLEDLKEPFTPEDPEKENIIIAYMPNGQYIGIKLFQSRPASFKSESSRLQWDRQAASNALTLKMQLEKGQIKMKTVLALLVTDLNLTDEEKATLDKERETEEKKSRVQFLKTEMKLIELDAKIKACLSLEKADTDMCLKLLDDLLNLDIKPLMLLKHPTCLETIKRMRAYVGNTPSWELSESAALVFTKQAHRIRKQADIVYKKIKDLFLPLEGVSFWEYFTNRVMNFKKVTSLLNADELLEMIHEPVVMSETSPYDMSAAVAEADIEERKRAERAEKAKRHAAAVQLRKEKKEALELARTPPKRKSARKQQQQDGKSKATEETPQPEATPEAASKETPEATTEATPEATTEATPEATPESTQEATPEVSEPTKPVEETPEKVDENIEKTPEDTPEAETVTESPTEEKEPEKEPEKEENGNIEKNEEEKNVEKEAEKVKEKEDIGEPRAKRSRESKKTEPPPPRSPAKRKTKF